ncbi:HIT family protein [Natronoglycomyces albus]|uniref:HIT domain-containing protein n=1 Tax=Natronoglycomyces albus TaxID=2811108 RepID=A0A895XLZ7_9ACTN|nr:hypothetical protein [Natronoglycomyces albus]QSB04802.1 hypothetical protein JQS30_13670 [Natronoglycomyces albus]
MSKELDAFRSAFRLDELTVYESERWILSVRPAQITLGSMVLSSKLGHETFAELDSQDSEEMGTMLAEAEHVAKELFGAVRINAVCLMMKDPIVHFHVLPRYEYTKDAFGRPWVDADWPGPPNFGGEVVKDEIILAELVGVIRSELSEKSSSEE